MVDTDPGKVANKAHPPKRVMVISPHSDDETFAMGGTIAKLVASGAEVFCLLMCAGNDFKFEHLGGKSVPAEVRVREFEAACAILGAKAITGNASTKESELDTVPIKSLVSRIEFAQDMFGPEVWYVCGPSFHQDHRAVFEAAMSAARPTRKSGPREIYKYELPTYSWNPREWTMDLHVFECINKFIDIKVKAVEAYMSQRRPEGSNLAVDGIVKHAAMRGLEAGCEYAEAFEVVRVVR